MVRVKPLPGGTRASGAVYRPWSRACRARWLPFPWFFGFEEQVLQGKGRVPV